MYFLIKRGQDLLATGVEQAKSLALFGHYIISRKSVKITVFVGLHQGGTSAGIKVFLVSGKESLYLPIEELFEQIMRRESGNIDLTLRSNNQRGTVGPIDGVSSKYLLKLIPVAVQTPRGGSVSLSNRPITQLLIEPEPNAPRDPATTALQPGGLFAGKLLSAPSGTIVRLLIRTDSFEEGRELTSYARQRGFRVDAKPLGPAEPVRITIGAGSNALAQ